MLANSRPWVDGIVPCEQRPPTYLGRSKGLCSQGNGVVGVGENKRSYTLSAVVYDMCIIYYKKALRFLAILGIVWETKYFKQFL